MTPSINSRPRLIAVIGGPRPVAAQPGRASRSAEPPSRRMRPAEPQGSVRRRPAPSPVGARRRHQAGRCAAHVDAAARA